MLTEKEQKDIDELKKNFNIVKENTNYDLYSFKRIEVSRKFTPLLLKISFFLNCFSILCFVIALSYFLFKPAPDFYASTPHGKVYGPLPKANR